MLIDLKDNKENIRRIQQEDLFRIGHFKTTQDLSKVAVGTTVKGSWPVTLTNGDKFDAVGTLKDYDALLKILIHRTIAKRRKAKDKDDKDQLV
jgi:hypothetical protein